MLKLEETPQWNEILELKDSLTLRDLALRFNVRPGTLSAALRRTNTSRAVQRASQPTSGPSNHSTLDDVARQRGVVLRPGSKDHLLLPHLDDLGQIPDAKVAELAGVSLRTVASFRTRNSISGYRRTPESRSTARPSRIDAVRDIVGQVGDREVADQAGVSISAVRAYRRKHGIDAATRTAPEPTPPMTSAAGQDAVWRIVLADERTGFMVAPDLATVASRLTDDQVVSVERVGELLK